MFGSAGSLNKEKTQGRFAIPTEAYRDEGISYHYAPPSDYIKIKNHEKLADVFNELHIPYVKGKVWTTDAFLRETAGQVAMRQEEGCIAVDMELASMQSVCDFYGFDLYDFLVTGMCCRKISTRWNDSTRPTIIWINSISLWRLRNEFRSINHNTNLRWHIMFNDGRSKKVVFIAHCFLNQNSISDGTAVYPSAFKSLIDYFLNADIGIVQMPCPELFCLGLDRGDLHGADRPVVVENTRIRSEMKSKIHNTELINLAGYVVQQILEYKKNGFEIIGIIGANRSPTCGVDTTSNDNA